MPKIEAALQSLQAHMAPAAREPVAVLLANLALCFHRADLPQQAWQAMMAQYLDDLAAFPLDLVEQACIAWRRTGKFYPRIAELYALCDAGLKERRQQILRLHLILGLPAPRFDAVVSPARNLAVELAATKRPEYLQMEHRRDGESDGRD